MTKLRLVSGIQPSGRTHLGNYLGALRRFVELQDDYECYFFLADLHTITVPQAPEVLRATIQETACIYLACGLDPNKATFFRQSDVAAHAELGWILTTQATMGEFSRMTQFKDKSRGQAGDSVGVGLFTYPALMAADILLYQVDAVPVGDDQKQHVEITRDLANRFNHRFGETLKVPEALIKQEGARIKGLDDPAKKMSKSGVSEYNYIALSDAPEVIQKKIKKAVTDSGSEVRSAAERPALTNLLNIYSLLDGRAVPELEEAYAGQQYGTFKTDLAEVIIEHLKPIQRRLAELIKDQPAVETILQSGADRARVVAEPTLAAVKQAVGL